MPLPNFLDLAAFAVDWQAVELLFCLQRQLAPLADNLSDSLALSGSEAYQAALIFYRNVKMAARSGVPNAKTIADDLSNRFPAAALKPSAPPPAKQPPPEKQRHKPHRQGRGTRPGFSSSR